jgi:hypothetical protein
VQDILLNSLTITTTRKSEQLLLELNPKGADFTKAIDDNESKANIRFVMTYSRRVNHQVQGEVGYTFHFP